MSDREGPRLTVKATCFGCAFEISESYRVQSDSGSNVYCVHPVHKKRRVGDTDWSTPDWCPVADLPAIRERIATPATTVDETDRLREEIGSAEWLNLMPREVVARAALNEGCRDKTAEDIRQGLHGDVKIRAEIAVKLVGFIQNQVRAALSDRPQAEGRHD